MTEHVQPTGANPESGFTLMELLVAITLLGFLSIGLYGGLSFGTRVWDRAEDATVDLNQVRAAQRLITEELSRAYPRVINAGTDTRTDFDGTRESIRFLAPAAPAIAPGGFMRVHLEVVREETGLSLIYAAGPELGLDEPERRVLLTGLEELSFSYFGAARYGEPGDWQEAWQNRMGLPLLVRIEARFTAESGASWPELIVATRISADQGCVYDALRKFCRGY